ncbi:MAG: ferrous iron transporter B, partial [Stenotrophomonas maltophilia]
MTATTATAPLRIALVGNPNSGKTALFNQLTGSRQKVANYTGVTVERKEGRMRGPSGQEYAVLDLPGAYSLHPASLDEAITRDLCRGFYPGEAAPDVLLCVIDATNLRLHLRFALELRELGKPMVVALNMVDAAQRRGIQVDVAALERELGVPVVETVAVRKQGAKALVERLDEMVPHLDAP